MTIGAAAFVGGITLATFASSPAVRAPYVVATLTPPSGQVLLLRAFAHGVQIYDCADQGSGAQWVFRAPEASLVDERGRSLGKHYGGPTWESNDGSKVVGRTVATSEASDPSAIPHLLLEAQSHAGDGVLSKVRSIQRLQTVGGRAPTQGCSEKKLGQQARVTYSATYYFYREPPVY